MSRIEELLREEASKNCRFCGRWNCLAFDIRTLETNKERVPTLATCPRGKMQDVDKYGYNYDDTRDEERLYCLERDYKACSICSEVADFYLMPCHIHEDTAKELMRLRVELHPRRSARMESTP